MPSLRQRRDDILPLARQFLAGAAKRFGKKSAGSFARSGESAAALHVAGNVRELENALERAWRLRGRIASASMTCRRNWAPRLRSFAATRFARSRRWNATTSPPRCAPQEATAPRRRKNWVSGPRRCTGNSSRRGHEPSHLDRFAMTGRCHPNTISPSHG